MLSAISGIGIKKAESLIKSFGNLSAVFSASVERLAEVAENIGKSKMLFEFLMYFMDNYPPITKARVRS